MSCTTRIITKLQRKFKDHYTELLFAPKFIQEVLYIDSQLKLDGPPEITLNLNELCDKVIDCVERSFLVLGDSGSGKTSFALKLCETLWSKRRLDDRTIIPIYIYLPSLVTKLNQNECNSESEFNIVKILVEEYGIHGIEECYEHIVLILDSFDEIISFSKRSKIIQNFWMNTSSWLSQVSVVTCSRPEAVPKIERREMFEFIKFGHVSHRKYSEFTLEGLSGDAISNFLQKMEMHVIPQLRNCQDKELIRWSAWGSLISKAQDWESGNYDQWFQDLPDLRKLSENPYILTLICQALPGIVLKLRNESEVLKKLCRTRIGIFSSFTEQVFEYQAQRVSQRPVNLKPGTHNISYRDWLVYFRAYAQNLAGKVFNYGNEEEVVKLSDRETLDSSLVEPVLNITQLIKLEKDHMDLFPPRLSHYEETKCGTVCNVSSIHAQNMKILRDACNGSILVFSANENEYKFIHRSMLEYLASEHAFESSLAQYDLILGQNMDKSKSSAIYGETGFGRALIKDRDILNQLVERMSFEYKKILFKLIRVSKEDSRLHRISANAITILNKAHVCFSGQDYRDIQIQGTDLRQSICARTDFRGANLTNVQFGESYLVGAQFQGACMEDIDFGESPVLKLSERLNSMVSYKEQVNIEDNWIIVTRDGAVRILNSFTLEEKLVVPRCTSYSVQTPSCNIDDKRISLLDEKVAVWAERTKYPPSPLPTTVVTYEVSLYDLFPKWTFYKKYTLQTIEGVDKIYIQFHPMDKCVFIYSTCHLEVLSYLSKTESVSDNLISATIGDGDPNKILTFVSIVDKNEDILIACHENCCEGQHGRIVVYKYQEDCNNFRPIRIFTGKQPFSGGAGKFESLRLDRILFKPDGTGLLIYNGARTKIRIFEDFSERITLIHPGAVVFISFAFDKIGKYLAGLAMTTNTVMIWSIPSGTIHRQFEYSIMCFPTHFSNPLAFSSDSKVLAFGGSEQGRS